MGQSYSSRERRNRTKFRHRCYIDITNLTSTYVEIQRTDKNLYFEHYWERQTHARDGDPLFLYLSYVSGLKLPCPYLLSLWQPIQLFASCYQSQKQWAISTSLLPDDVYMMLSAVIQTPLSTSTLE